MNREQASELKTTPALNPQTISSDTTTAGTIIDTQGYDALFFAMQSGTLTDGTYTPLIQHGDESDLSDAAAVDDADLTATEASAAFAATDDNVCKKIGYLGTKRYVRLSFVSASTSSGGVIGAQAVLGRGRQQPEA